MLEYRRRLPHFQPDDVYVFLTWRLWGSLPANRQRRTYPTPGHAFVATDRALDCHRSGPLWLKDPRIAALVVQSIQIGESDKRFYELCAWVVMPNHVRLLIQPRADLPLITRWWDRPPAEPTNCWSAPGNGSGRTNRTIIGQETSKSSSASAGTSKTIR